MQMHTEFRGIPRNSGQFYCKKIPRNSAEFRGIPSVFQKIPYSVGSQKRTSVDTLIGPQINFEVKTSNFCFPNLLNYSLMKVYDGEMLPAFS